MVKRNAVFLDRDGVINRKMPEGDYVKSRDEFEFLFGVFEACRILKENGYLCIVISNQRCIARGIITKQTLHNINDTMIAEINRQGGQIDAIYYCPHDHHDRCDCRKPKPGMIFNAVRDYRSQGIDISLSESYFIGDSLSDIEAGKAAGTMTVFIGTNPVAADMWASSLIEAVRAIVATGSQEASMR